MPKRSEHWKAMDKGVPGWWGEFQAVLDRWRGTPYSHGQGLCGVAADCIGFVAGVLDELHGLELPPPERHAPDLAWHDRRRAVQITLRISGRWPHVVVRGFWTPEPGDVLICRVGQSPTGHVMLMGVNPNEVWHCDSDVGVCYTGLGVVRSRVVRVWRPTEKVRWRQHYSSGPPCPPSRSGPPTSLPG